MKRKVLLCLLVFAVVMSLMILLLWPPPQAEVPVEKKGEAGEAMPEPARKPAVPHSSSPEAEPTALDLTTLLPGRFTVTGCPDSDEPLRVYGQIVTGAPDRQLLATCEARRARGCARVRAR